MTMTPTPLPTDQDQVETEQKRFPTLLCIAPIFLALPAVVVIWRRGGIDRLRSWQKERLDPDARAIRDAKAAQKKADKARDREAKKVARRTERRLKDAVTRLGLNHNWKEDGKVRVSQIKFDYCLITDAALYYKIKKTPYGINFKALLDEEVLDHLSISIGRTIDGIRSVQYGGYYVAHLRTGIRRIPALFRWYDAGSDINAIDLLPASRPLAVALGLGENRKLVYEDVREWPHLLIGGATKWGKTTWIHQALCTLIQRNDPSDLRLILFDFKRVELRFYREIPHLFETDAIITDHENALDWLKLIESEMERRLTILESAEKSTIEGYNYSHRRRSLPYLVVVLDELADLMLNDKLKGPIQHLIQRLAQLGRAVGVHMIVATQIPKREVIPTLIKGNLVARGAFNCASHTESKLLLDHGGAKGLEAKGRMIYQFAGQEFEVQGPLITIEQVQQVVKNAIGGTDSDDVEISVPPLEMFTYSLAELGGNLPIRGLHNHFRSAGASHQYIVNTMQDFQFDPESHGPIVNLNARAYIVLPSNGKRPRRLYQLEDPEVLPDSTRVEQLVRG